ncbi:zinc finger BED domain-containing protein RICESLEEPER 2-like [Rhizophagus clarus]|uniref:Zinc finger BED domain-containing protein RICESLEEPER 2-like n=1 Tax=Rhizophagus clarus TaxID=94130 RepID=A0A8H3LWI6_9GLOM|nr:zinc finger BED domain-containing protein RICESLEEPER 2-like [Rhizophagus clarus]
MSYSNYDFEDFNNFDEFEPFEQDAPPIEDEENDDNYEDSEDETSPQSRQTSPTWKYFNEQTIQHPGYPIGNVKNTGKNQSTLDFRRTDPWPEKEKNERDIAVVEWVIGDAQLFRSVENLRFKIMINKFDSRYQIPDEKTVKTLVVDYFKEKRKNIQEDLNAIPGKLSLTADMWTSTCNNDAFLGLTIHYIDNNWNLKNFLLDIISFTTRHTGNNIANAIKSVLTEFNLLEKTLALTTDNESAMVVCGRIIAEELTRELNDQSFRHYRYSAHILNLAAQQGIKIIDDEVVKIRELMKKIKHSTLRCDRLRELCSIENLTYYKPQLDVETRWNSTYYMIVKFQKMLRPIEMLAATDQDIKKFVPDAQEWIKINDTLTLLEPLEKATVLLSASSYPTISDVRFLFLGIQQHLNDYIGKEGFSQKESTNAINAVKRRFSEYHTPMSQPAVINHDNGEVASTHDYFHQLKRRRLNNSTLNITRPSSGIYEEIDRYLALPCDDNVAPLLWWQAHFREFPALGAMARDYLSIQATSVACEQAFSVASNTITRTRNRLQPDMSRALLCSKSWLEKGIGEKRN